MAANSNTINTFPRVWEAQDSVTRPANATQYAAGDAVSDNATTATSAGYFALDFKTKFGAGITLTDFTLHKSDHDVTSAAFALLLFTEAPAFAGWEDNAPLAITDAEMQECKGVVPFSADDWTNVVTGDVQTVSRTIGVVLDSADTKVYGILVAADTYTPASGEVFTVTAHALQD